MPTNLIAPDTLFTKLVSLLIFEVKNGKNGALLVMLLIPIDFVFFSLVSGVLISMSWIGFGPGVCSLVLLKLHAHSGQYASNLVSTRRALEKTCATNHHQDQEWGTASHAPDPH